MADNGKFSGREVVIVEAVRTPVGRGHEEKGYYKDVHASTLLARTYSELIDRAGIDASEVEDVVAGCVQQFGEQAINIGRNACFIAEPIQGEGGDRHFRARYFAAMRALCDEFDALLIFDEVQTGCGLTGTAWAYQQLGVTPDVVAFGKKTQVCGVMAGGRVDEVPDNVFTVSSRINSTWGGNLVDMVRSRRILETIAAEELFDNAAEQGAHLLVRLGELAADLPETVLDVRGRGLMCAFTLPSVAERDELTNRLWQRGVVMLACGERSVRFRPALTVTRAEIDIAVSAVRDALS